MAELSVAELEARFEAVQDRPVDDRERIDAANALAWMIALNDRNRSLVQELQQTSPDGVPADAAISS